jgi:hypothetical protein
MGEWSLRSEQTLGLEALKAQVGSEYFNHEGIAFIKGGIWKNFFVKYEESNYLHKRMLYISQKQDKLKIKAKENLYKLQTNDVFWHGVFGGLYLPNLRDNAYTYLMALEKEFATKNIQYEIKDIDMDGYDELKVLSKQLSFVFSSKNGAQMIEFGALDVGFNWQNTLTRRKEAYHDKILNPPVHQPIQEHHDDAIATIHNAPNAIDEKLRENLIFDWHLKYSFVDHFLLEPMQLSQFKAANFREIGDFANQPFELDAKTKTFTRQGGIYLGQHYPTTLTKKFSFSQDMVSLDQHVQTHYQGTLYYGVEFNLHFAHPLEVRFNGEAILDGLVLQDLEQLIIFDSFTHKTISLSMNQHFDCAAFILNTVSQSENGFDLVAQQISFVLSLPLHDDEHVTLSLGVKDV